MRVWWRSVQAHRYPLGYSTLKAGLRGLPACFSFQAWLPRQGLLGCPRPVRCTALGRRAGVCEQGQVWALFSSALQPGLGLPICKGGWDLFPSVPHRVLKCK